MTLRSRFTRAAGMALVAPTAERVQHGAVTRAAETIADSHGNIGLPWRAEGPLARMERKGEIDAAQLMAGYVFHRWFQTAALDPLRAAALGQRLDPSRGSGGALIEIARNRVNGALDACGGIGSPCGSVCWHVLGLESSIADWARREGWSGRPLRHESAKLVLAGALSVLAAHFRLERT
jgi:hypothetical protein